MLKRTLVILLLLMSLAATALAGANGMTVATNGRGIEVYATSGGRKAVGLLYNGYSVSLGLEETNGRYDCWLTHDLTVWVDQDEAMKHYPVDERGFHDYDLLYDDPSALPSNLFVAEVTQADAPVYADTAHEHVLLHHAPGTLLTVCGEFGDDYLIDMQHYSGLIPKSAVRHVSDLPAGRDVTDAVALQTRRVYTGGPNLALGHSATGFSSLRPSIVHDGDEVQVLREKDGWAQLSNHAFIETRFLDPAGDHSIRYATVTSSRPLNRLNLRTDPDPDAYVTCKLFAGTKVQLPAHTDEWASVYVSGEDGGWYTSGSVMLEYLTFDDSAPDARPRVRLTQTLYGGNGGSSFRASWSGDALPAGTGMTVFGVDAHFNASESDDCDRFYCLLDDGRLVCIWDDGGVFEPLSCPDATAKARSSVRLREFPSQQAPVLRSLSSGAKVTVLLRGEGWTMVEYKGQRGYVMSRYLSFP